MEYSTLHKRECFLRTAALICSCYTPLPDVSELWNGIICTLNFDREDWRVNFIHLIAQFALLTRNALHSSSSVWVVALWVSAHSRTRCAALKPKHVDTITQYILQVDRAIPWWKVWTIQHLCFCRERSGDVICQCFYCVDETSMCTYQRLLTYVPNFVKL